MGNLVLMVKKHGATGHLCGTPSISYLRCILVFRDEGLAPDAFGRMPQDNKLARIVREYHYLAKEEAEVRERGWGTDAERKRRHKKEEARAG